MALRVRRYDLSINDLAEKSRTSPAIFDGRANGSRQVMVWTPGTAVRRFCQNATGPAPIGEITPNPVSTVRRELVVMSITRVGIAFAWRYRTAYRLSPVRL